MPGIYETYSAMNSRIARGEQVHYGQIGTGYSCSPTDANGKTRLSYPKIGVYTGSGTSHSWLWFTDLFDRMGFYDISLLDENRIRTDVLNDLDVLVMSGGDTFSIAERLGKMGADRMRDFINNGGLYIGSCAGAYLPLNSSKKHLNLFNYVNARISNLTGILPEAKRVPEKFCTPYGCSFVFHPVREEVKIITNGTSPFKDAGVLSAPLYGGPAMIASDGVKVLATYQRFTEKTVFLVADEIAEQTVIGKAAVINAKLGSGCLYLFGPHFEHPHYPLANKLLADVIYWGMRNTPLIQRNEAERVGLFKGKQAKQILKDLKREVSNSRIVAFGMEMTPVRWLIGQKIYEPTKIRVFLEAIWFRLKILEKLGEIRSKSTQHERMIRYASASTFLLRTMKEHLGRGDDKTDLAEELFTNLRMMSAIFLEIYFSTVKGNFISQEKHHAL